MTNGSFGNSFGTPDAGGQKLADMRYSQSLHNLPQTTLEETQQMLAMHGVRPVANGPLPVSPLLKKKGTDELYPWTPDFAEMFDTFDNCDEQGNTDPAAWQGKPIYIGQGGSVEGTDYAPVGISMPRSDRVVPPVVEVEAEAFGTVEYQTGAPAHTGPVTFDPKKLGFVL